MVREPPEAKVSFGQAWKRGQSDRIPFGSEARFVPSHLWQRQHKSEIHELLVHERVPHEWEEDDLIVPESFDEVVRHVIDQVSGVAPTPPTPPDLRLVDAPDEAPAVPGLPTLRFCIHCGARWYPGARFCAACGEST
jgi:hypothetical protein